MVRSNHRSYRGIGLHLVLGKILEKFMVSRLKECYSKGEMPHQAGFTKGKSTVDTWMHVQNSLSGIKANYVVAI